MLYKILLVLFASWFASAGSTTIPDSIAIRHDVDDNRYIELGSDFPATVRVGERGGDGTLVSPEWVVTAAHVAAGVVRRYGDDLKIFVDDESEGISVAQVIVHPEFRPMGDYDIALIRLATLVENIAPAQLYSESDEAGKQIFIVGHGDTKKGTGGEWVSDRKRRAATNIIDGVDDLHIMFDFDDPNAPKGTITELEGTAGPGDSGGPAYIVHNDITYLAGVSSRGRGGANGPGTYGAEEHYVRVSSHVDWLQAQMDDPPNSKLVNMPEAGDGPVVRRGPGPGGPGGGMPPGAQILESIGLIVADRDGAVHMIGRIDEKFPSVLLDGGVRPPARIVSINGKHVGNAKALHDLFEAVNPGDQFTLDVLHSGKELSFILTR